MPGGAQEPAGSAKPMFGAVVVGAGLITIVIVFIASIVKFSSAQDVVAVVGAATGVIGTIVTAFFGIQSTAAAGSDATQKVTDAHENLQSTLLTLAAHLPDGLADHVLSGLGITHSVPAPPQENPGAPPPPAVGG